MMVSPQQIRAVGQPGRAQQASIYATATWQPSGGRICLYLLARPRANLVTPARAHPNTIGVHFALIRAH